MALAAEHRAILLVVGLAVAGHGVRCFLLRPDEAPGSVRLLDGGADGSAARHRDSSAAAARPLGPNERIDLDRAPVAELARLPRVGTAMARRIVARRDSLGAVGGLAGLDQVPGVGPALLREIAPHVAFSRSPSAPAVPPSPPGPRPAPAGAPAGLPPPPVVDVNSASEQQLTSLPGIGPAKARAIVAWRSEHGPFRAVDDLARVPGIGPALLSRLAGRVAVH